MLVQLFVMVLVMGLLYWLVSMLPVPEPFKTILVCIVILACIIWLLNVAGLLGGGYGVNHPLIR
jgi:hypothetical protein